MSLGVVSSEGMQGVRGLARAVDVPRHSERSHPVKISVRLRSAFSIEKGGPVLALTERQA